MTTQEKNLAQYNDILYIGGDNVFFIINQTSFTLSSQFFDFLRHDSDWFKIGV